MRRIAHRDRPKITVLRHAAPTKPAKLVEPIEPAEPEAKPLDFDDMSRDQLRDAAKERDLPTTGSKAELVERLKGAS